MKRRRANHRSIGSAGTPGTNLGRPDRVAAHKRSRRPAADPAGRIERQIAALVIWTSPANPAGQALVAEVVERADKQLQGKGPPSFAELCYEAAGGDPELALIYAVSNAVSIVRRAADGGEQQSRFAVVGAAARLLRAEQNRPDAAEPKAGIKSDTVADWRSREPPAVGRFQRNGRPRRSPAPAASL